jgi:hypothetical protein
MARGGTKKQGRARSEKTGPEILAKGQGQECNEELGPWATKNTVQHPHRGNEEEITKRQQVCANCPHTWLKSRVKLEVTANTVRGL